MTTPCRPSPSRCAARRGPVVGAGPAVQLAGTGIGWPPVRTFRLRRGGGHPMACCSAGLGSPASGRRHRGSGGRSRALESGGPAEVVKEAVEAHLGISHTGNLDADGVGHRQVGRDTRPGRSPPGRSRAAHWRWPGPMVPGSRRAGVRKSRKDSPGRGGCQPSRARPGPPGPTRRGALRAKRRLGGLGAGAAGRGTPLAHRRTVRVDALADRSGDHHASARHAAKAMLTLRG